MPHPQSSEYPGPSIRDWSLLTLSFGCVVMAALLLGRSRDVAIPSLALFGFCSAIAARTVVRKLRFRSLRPLSVEIAGGTPIRPARGYLAAMAASLLGLGGVLLAYWHAGRWLLVGCVIVILAAGVALAVGLLTGRLPVGFLRFDPGGMTIGFRSYTLMLPWDSIQAVRSGEFHDNPVLLLWVRDPHSVLVEPPQAGPRALKTLHSNLAWVGAHVMILTSQYRIDLPFLATAIEAYVTKPETRDALGVPRLAAPNE